MNDNENHDPTDREPAVLWYALHKGELCRIRKPHGGGMVCEVWREGSWTGGPDFAVMDFTGRMISEAEARTWIRLHFRSKAFRRNRDR